MEAIILAGGLGTRLQSVVKKEPKVMAKIKGKPFLHYLFKYLAKSGIEKVILSVGYKHESVLDYFKYEYSGVKINYCIEEKCLGTGGAIKKSLSLVNNENVFILNGDTLFIIDLLEMSKYQRSTSADVVIALKQIQDSERYGKVEIDDTGRVKHFSEKEFIKSGYINGGLYLVKKDFLTKVNFSDDSFSIEKDVFEKYFNDILVYGFCSNDFFIDIGIPEDYSRAQNLL